MMMRKLLAGSTFAGVLLFGTASVGDAQETASQAETTPPATAETDDDNNDDGSKVGLLGLLGLAGLAGLAGLRRRDPDIRFDRPVQPR